MTDQQTLESSPESPAEAADPVAAPTAPDAPEVPEAIGTPDALGAAEPGQPGEPGDPGPTPAAPSPPRRHRSVSVPMWLLVLVLGVAAVAGAFLVGRETAPETSDNAPHTLAEAVEQTASGEMEVGDFDARTLLQALSTNQDLDLGSLGDILFGGNGQG